jgi:peptide/nickel transport system permease protein
MTAFLIRRVLMTLPVVWVVVTLVFAFIHLVPGDPVAQMLGEGASVTEVERLRSELGLDRPVWEQYVVYLGGLVRGDLGFSFRNQQTVLSAIAERYPATIQLTLAAVAISLMIAVPGGVVSAVRRGSPTDQSIGMFTLVGVSVPNFVLGPLLILFFSIGLGWFPVSGRGSLLHLVLPAITLGGAMAAISTRMVRSSMLEEIRQDYVRTARAKGLSERRAMYGHALRNGLVPVVTVIGIHMGNLLAGAVVTETIFSWPGLGQLLIQSINARDYPLVQGAVLAIALSYILVNLTTDVVYSFIDPRIRYD